MATVMGGEQTARSWVWRFRDSLQRFFDSDIFFSFRRSPVTVLAFVTTVIFFVAAFAAPILAPFNTNDVATLNLMDAFQPPAWLEGGTGEHLLGTDDQGRDVLSAIMFGTQVSLLRNYLSFLTEVSDHPVPTLFSMPSISICTDSASAKSGIEWLPPPMAAAALSSCSW